MKKKTTVLVALISMCVIVTAGIGAVSASDETSGDHVNYVITIFKINPDGTTTTIETFESSGPIVVKETLNEDGSRNITKEEREMSEDELFSNREIIEKLKITPETELPIDIEGEGFRTTAITLELSERIEPLLQRLYTAKRVQRTM